MLIQNPVPSQDGLSTVNDILFGHIAEDIEKQGYSIHKAALPSHLASNLLLEQQSMAADKFKRAGIGRGSEHLENETIRTDEICWVTNSSSSGKAWLDWSSELQSYLNRRLYLGLFSFESHFAHYGPGDYYKRHYDAFSGEANRVLTLIVYFNNDWHDDNGGELVLYKNDRDLEGIKVMPQMGTLVTFLSEEFPHEVLAANKDRYSIAGWFRLNTSLTDKIDPPV